MILQVLTLIIKSHLKERKIIYLHLHVNTLDSRMQERYCHFFLTVKMERKRATISLKEACWQGDYYEGEASMVEFS